MLADTIGTLIVSAGKMAISGVGPFLSAHTIKKNLGVTINHFSSSARRGLKPDQDQIHRKRSSPNTAGQLMFIPGLV